MDKFHPGYFGKVGMRTFHQKKCATHCRTINVDKLWSLVPLTPADAAEDSSKVPVINCSKAGIFKVLGKGRIPDVPFVCKARLFTKEAEAKIVAAGGACVLIAE